MRARVRRAHAHQIGPSARRLPANNDTRTAHAGRRACARLQSPRVWHFFSPTLPCAPPSMAQTSDNLLLSDNLGDVNSNITLLVASRGVRALTSSLRTQGAKGCACTTAHDCGCTFGSRRTPHATSSMGKRRATIRALGHKRQRVAPYTRYPRGPV